jgi:8-oxo-dGTP pyrophosphatase MutT (NUDIX family)
MSIQRTIRAGVIPYTMHKGQLHFLFGQDKRSNDLCDFGGGRKKGETSHDAALREFKEETNGLFGEGKQVTLDKAKGLVCRHRKNMIFFLPVDPYWIHTASDEFDTRNQQTPNKEISGVVWVDEDLYRNLVYERVADNNPIIWEKLRSFLYKYSNDEKRFLNTLKRKFDKTTF